MLKEDKVREVKALKSEFVFALGRGEFEETKSGEAGRRGRKGLSDGFPYLILQFSELSVRFQHFYLFRLLTIKQYCHFLPGFSPFPISLSSVSPLLSFITSSFTIPHPDIKANLD